MVKPIVAGVIIGSHSWQGEVKSWTQPWEYEAWKRAVCGDRVHDENSLRAYHAAQWEPADCAQYLAINKMLHKVPVPRKAPKERVVILDAAKINRRYALALWREGSKLATRRMTPEARRIVEDTQARMEKILGIERS